jgi:hypothetical protein
MMVARVQFFSTTIDRQRVAFSARPAINEALDHPALSDKSLKTRRFPHLRCRDCQLRTHPPRGVNRRIGAPPSAAAALEPAGWPCGLCSR